MLPILQIGPLAIQTPGLLILAGVWIATTLLDKEAPRLRLPAGTLSNMVFLGLVSGVIGARLWYALRFVSVYLEDPLSLLSLNPTTLSPLGGALVGIGTAVIYGTRKKLPLWLTLDALTPGLAGFALALGFANLASGDGFGSPTEAPWAIELWGAMRHPSQIYELLVGGLIFWGVWELRLRTPFPGFLFLTFCALTAAGRIGLEAFRGDSVIVLGSLRSAQIGGLLVLAGALAALHLLATRSRLKSQNP